MDKCTGRMVTIIKANGKMVFKMAKVSFLFNSG